MKAFTAGNRLEYVVEQSSLLRIVVMPRVAGEQRPVQSHHSGVMPSRSGNPGTDTPINQRNHRAAQRTGKQKPEMFRQNSWSGTEGCGVYQDRDSTVQEQVGLKPGDS